MELGDIEDFAAHAMRAIAGGLPPPAVALSGNNADGLEFGSVRLANVITEAWVVCQPPATTAMALGYSGHGNAGESRAVQRRSSPNVALERGGLRRGAQMMEMLAAEHSASVASEHEANQANLDRAAVYMHSQYEHAREQWTHEVHETRTSFGKEA